MMWCCPCWRLRSELWPGRKGRNLPRMVAVGILLVGEDEQSTTYQKHSVKDTGRRSRHSIWSSSKSTVGCPRCPPLRSLMHSQGWSQPSQPKPVCVVRGCPRANGAGPRAAGTRARALRRRSGSSAVPLSPSTSKVTQPRSPGAAGELGSPEPPRREAGGEGMAIAFRAKSACAFGSLLCARIALGVTP